MVSAKEKVRDRDDRRWIFTFQFCPIPTQLISIPSHSQNLSLIPIPMGYSHSRPIPSQAQQNNIV